MTSTMVGEPDMTTLICRSFYTFNEVARHELIEKFKNISANGVHIEAGLNNCFVIKCPKDDNSCILTFWPLMRGYIAQELGNRFDVFEEPKVKRIANTQLEADDNLAPLTEFKETDEAETLIPYAAISEAWNPKIVDPVTGVSIGVDHRLLGKIGRLSGCSLEPADGGSITVKGESREDVKRAMTKLDVVTTWADYKSRCPYNFDFAYTGELSTVLHFKNIKDLRDRRLTSTLLPFNSNLIRYLATFVTIADRATAEFLLPASPTQSEACLLWTDHLYKPLGDKNMNNLGLRQGFCPPRPIVSAPPLPYVSMAPVSLDHWVDQSASEALEDPFAPSSSTRSGPGSSTHDSIIPGPTKPAPAPALVQPPAPAPAPRKRFIKTRKPVGIDAETKDVSNEPVASSSREMPGGAASEIVSLSFVAPHPATPPVEPPHMRGLIAPHLRIPTSESPPMPKAAELQGPGSTRKPIPPHMRMPPIEPPHMPKVNTSYVESDQWKKTVVLPGRMGILVDVSEPDTLVEDRIQPINEFDTRTLRYTMNQRKSATEVNESRQQMSALLKEMELAITTVLNMARFSPNPVNFRMQVGRLLIDPKTGSQEFKRKHFHVDQFDRVFNNKANIGNKLVSLFTQMLTTSSVDAQFILSLKYPSGQNMFRQPPVERRVTYRFNCTAKTGDQLLVVVDEQGEFQINGNEFVVGALNWHFPKRFWDARLTINSSEPLRDDLQNSAEEMIANLCIQPSEDRKTFELSTKVENGGLNINSVSLHRETCHLSTDYPDIKLHLSEVQELMISQPPTPEASELKVSYKASVRSEQDSGCKIWWEVSLSSICGDKMLEQADSFELGDQAAWMADEILHQNVVKDLGYVARDVVERIDAVGTFNKGPKSGVCVPRASETGPSVHPTAAVESVRPLIPSVFAPSVRGGGTTIYGVGSVRGETTLPGFTYW